MVLFINSLAGTSIIFALVKRKKLVLENIPVTGYAAEGKALARIGGKVIFIDGAVPGDVADVLITKNKNHKFDYIQNPVYACSKKAQRQEKSRFNSW